MDATRNRDNHSRKIFSSAHSRALFIRECTARSPDLSNLVQLRAAWLQGSGTSVKLRMNRPVLLEGNQKWNCGEK